jgi:carbon-monoxide dehydrogenase medium subunit
VPVSRCDPATSWANRVRVDDGGIHDVGGIGVKPAVFTHHAPEQVDEVIRLLSEHGEEAKVLAGGQSLVPMLALRLARFEHLVDVNEVEGLAGVHVLDGSIRVGAGTRHRTVERSTEVAGLVPLLARATAEVGHFQIRNRGTVGGAIAHADPAAEQPAVALALDAVMEIAGTGGTRDVAAADFFQGTWTTALAPDELLVAVRFPIWAGRTGFAVVELARRAGDFAIVGVVCGIGLDDAGSPSKAAIGLFGVGSTPVRATAAEQAVVAGASSDEVANAVQQDIDPGDDLHASATYRRTVAGVLVRRAVEQATAEAQRSQA